MKRISLWLLTLSAGLLAWPYQATVPPNLKTALRVQQEILDREPANALAWNDLGNLYLVADQLDRAEDAYRRSIEIDPRYVAAHFNFALLLQQTGQSARAEEALRRVIEIDPHHAWAHYQLGVVLERKRERAKALDHYARALAYDPSLSFAHNNPHVIENEMLGEALLRAQKYSDPPGKRVPRQYGEADRIVDLMLRGQAEGVGAGSGDVPGSGGSGQGGSGQGGSGLNQDAGNTPRPRSGKDAARGPGADDRNLTRVTVGGRPGRADATPTAPAARRNAAERPATRESDEAERRTLTREDLRTRGSNGTAAPPSSRSGGERAVPPPPPPRSSRYIPPSRRSTGQLDLQLLPEAAPEERLASLGGTAF